MPKRQEGWEYCVGCFVVKHRRNHLHLCRLLRLLVEGGGGTRCDMVQDPLLQKPWRIVAPSATLVAPRAEEAHH